jgi:threonine dehydratase
MKKTDRTTQMPTIEDIKAARERLRRILRVTPLTRSGFFSREAKRDVWIKYENLQKSGAFKIRGAYNTLHLLSKEERSRGVIATSAGNHAQGVAVAAHEQGVSAVIVMPESTPLAKISATENYGAKVILYGNNYDEAHEHTLELIEEHNYCMIHPFNDPRVIAGQGTLGLEILEQCPGVECIVVPIGGGGLISGIALAVKALRPKVRIIGVEPAGAACMKRSLEDGKLHTLNRIDTIADGIAVKRPGELTFRIIQQYVDEVVVVSDHEIAVSVMRLLERNKTLVEAAGAAAIAAIEVKKIPGEGDCCVGVIGGGNIDLTLLDRFIDRGLQNAGRLARLRIKLLDKPGSLVALSKIIADTRSNILHIHYDRKHLNLKYTEALVELTVESRNREHLCNVVEAVRAGGFPVEVVQREDSTFSYEEGFNGSGEDY